MWDVTNGATAACKGCSRAYVPTRSVGQGFAPHPTEGHHSQGGSLPLQPVSIWPCCGKCLKALAELCRKSHRWMEQCTPQAGEVLHVPRHVMPVSPLLPCSSPWGLPLQTSSTHIPLQQVAWKDPSGETGNPTTSQSSPTHQLRTKDVGHAQRDPELQNAD